MGVTIENNLNLGSHVNNISCSAKRTLGYILEKVFYLCDYARPADGLQDSHKTSIRVRKCNMGPPSDIPHSVIRERTKTFRLGYTFHIQKKQL